MSINSVLPLILVSSVALTLVCGNLWWKSASTELGARLDTSKQPLSPKDLFLTEHSSLLPPVQRYLSIALPGGNQLVEDVTIQQTGEFNQNELNPAWKPFTAIHRASTRRPGFIWDARIRLFPGITKRVRDAYVAGEGMLRAALFGLFPVAHLQDSGDLAKGELMRYLAEMASYPTAQCPTGGVK